jgi:hypothetical protein
MRALSLLVLFFYLGGCIGKAEINAEQKLSEAVKVAEEDIRISTYVLGNPEFERSETLLSIEEVKDLKQENWKKFGILPEKELVEVEYGREGEKYFVFVDVEDRNVVKLYREMALGLVQ